jgi:hypothetical protein
MGPLEEEDEIALLPLDGLNMDATVRVEDDGAIPVEVDSVEEVKNDEKERNGPRMGASSKFSVVVEESDVDELNVVRPVLLMSGDPEVIAGAS